MVSGSSFQQMVQEALGLCMQQSEKPHIQKLTLMGSLHQRKTLKLLEHNIRETLVHLKLEFLEYDGSQRKNVSALHQNEKLLLFKDVVKENAEVPYTLGENTHNHIPYRLVSTIRH